MIFENDKVYDILKRLASPILPAVASLFIAIAAILGNNGLPGVLFFSVAGAIIGAVGACLGEITHQSSKKYLSDKQIVPLKDENQIHTNPEDSLKEKD